MKTLKIALYQTEHNTEIVDKADRWIESNDSYVRVSHIQKVDFEMIEHSAIVGGQVKQIDKKIEMLQAETENEITELKRRRNELLALPNPG